MNNSTQTFTNKTQFRISTDTRLNMTLDEIIYLNNLEKQNEDLKKQNEELKKNYMYIEHKYEELDSWYTELYYKTLENSEIIELDYWKIHKTDSNNEYVSGFKTLNKYKSDFDKYEENLWETSNILSKTATENGLFVITKTEHIYYLPYNESYNNY